MVAQVLGTVAPRTTEDKRAVVAGPIVPQGAMREPIDVPFPRGIELEGRPVLKAATR